MSAVRDSIREHGQRYLDRVYTTDELAECDSTFGLDAERLAARFAAKEAAMKVLLPGEATVVPWTSIEVHRAEHGAFFIKLKAEAAELAAKTGVGELSVSLTHEAGFAAAIVVATAPETGGEADG